MRRELRTTVAALLLAVVSGLALAGSASGLAAGDKAPDFTLPGSAGKPVKLGDLLGKGPVVIYTLIQAFTPT
jgi:hypothetical protein